MTLAETIQTHVQALPPALQRETLDFIAWLETRYGIAAPGLPAFSLSETDAFLQRHADALSDDFPDGIDDSDLPSVPFDDAAAECCGEIRAALVRQGQPIGPYDLQIAAIALARGFTVVTNNTHEFIRVPGLTVEDWQQ